MRFLNRRGNAAGICLSAARARRARRASQRRNWRPASFLYKLSRGGQMRRHGLLLVLRRWRPSATDKSPKRVLNNSIEAISSFLSVAFGRGPAPRRGGCPNAHSRTRFRLLKTHEPPDTSRGVEFLNWRSSRKWSSMFTGSLLLGRGFKLWAG